MANFGTSRFFNTLPSGGGLSFYDITIDDNSGTPVSISFTTQSCRIKYETESEKRFTPIVTSSLELEILIDSAAVETALENLIAAQEGRYTIKVEKNLSLYWVGYILADQIEFKDLSYEHKPTFKIKAVDGIARLKTVDYKQANGNAYSGKEMLVDHLRRIISYNTFPSSFFATTDQMLWSYLDWSETSATALFNTMRSTRINHLAFINIDSDGNNVYTSVYDVLKNICTVFGARFFWSEGRYNFIQVNSYTNTSSTYTIYKWVLTLGNTAEVSSNLASSYEADTGSLAQYDGGTVDSYKLSGDTWGNYAPVKRVSVSYKHTAIFNLLFGSNWSNANTPFTYLFSEIDSNSGNAALAFRSSYTFTIAVTQADVTAVRINFKVNLKVGSKYYKRESVFVYNQVTYNPGVWVTANEDYEFATNGIPIATNIPSTQYSNINFVTDDVPEDGDLEFSINIEGVYDQYGTLINPLNYTLTWLFGNPYLEMWYGGNVEDQSAIRRFQATNNNTNDNTEVIEIETVLGDGPNGSVLGALEVFTGSEYVSSAAWQVGGAGTAKQIGQLLANEVIKGQTNPVLKMQSATFYGTNIEYHKALTYFSNKYLPITVTFDLGQDTWSGLYFLFENISAFSEETEEDLPGDGLSGAPSDDVNFPTDSFPVEESTPFPDPILTDSITEITTEIASGSTVTSIPIDPVANTGLFVKGDLITVVAADGIYSQDFEVSDNGAFFENTSTDTSIPVIFQTANADYGVGSYIKLNDQALATALGFARLKTMRFQLYTHNEAVHDITNSAIASEAWFVKAANTGEYKDAYFVGIRAYFYELHNPSNLNTYDLSLKKNPSSPVNVETMQLNNGYSGGTDLAFAELFETFHEIEDQTIYYFTLTGASGNTGNHPKGLFVELLYTRLMQ